MRTLSQTHKVFINGKPFGKPKVVRAKVKRLNHLERYERAKLLVSNLDKEVF